MKFFSTTLISTALIAASSATPMPQEASITNVLKPLGNIGQSGSSRVPRNLLLSPRNWGYGHQCGTCDYGCNNLPPYQDVLQITSQLQTVQSITVSTSTNGAYGCNCQVQDAYFEFTVSETITQTLTIQTSALTGFLRNAFNTCRHRVGGTRYVGGTFTIPTQYMTCQGDWACSLPPDAVTVTVGTTGSCEDDNSCEPECHGWYCRK